MLNKVILIGRLTKDPELKYTPSNVAVCTFSVAVDRKFVKPGEQRQADFINCVAWRNSAEFLSKYFKKGQLINIVGNLQTRSWTDNNDQKRVSTEVIVDEVNFCGGKSEGSSTFGNHTSSRDDFGSMNLGPEDSDGFITIDAEDDLPF